jgi:hypothetical protein
VTHIDQKDSYKGFEKEFAGCVFENLKCLISFKKVII